MSALPCRSNLCLFDILNGLAIKLDDVVTTPNLEGDLELSIELFVHRHFRAMFFTYIFAEVDDAGCEIYVPAPLQLIYGFDALPGCDGDYNKQAEVMTHTSVVQLLSLAVL